MPPDANTLLKAAADWFGEALRQHVRSSPPGQVDEWLAMFESGQAQVAVVVHLAPNPEICCTFQVGEQLITFHKTPLQERPEARH